MIKKNIALCAALGLFYAISGYAGMEEAKAAYAKGDYATALQEIRPLANKGNAAAQNLLGLIYADGQGIPQDYAQALAWYRKAAEQGYAAAKNNLGVAYFKGEGVPQDYVQAVVWFRKAAEQGYVNAQSNLGVAYYNGEGVPQDYAQAAAWYRKAADQCYPNAQAVLADMYFDGIGVRKDRAVGFALYSASAPNYDPAKYNRAAEIVHNLSSSPTSYSMSYKELEEGKMLAEQFKQPGGLLNALNKRDLAYQEEPKEEQVVSTGVSVVPGAIVCPDFRTVQFMFDWYTTHWEDEQRNVLTNGQSRLIEGETSPPNFKLYGCALIPPGTSLILQKGNVVPVVTTKLPNGKVISGVTLPSMIGR